MKNKKKKLIIYSDSSQDNFGLGDYLRLVSFIPNLKFSEILWVGDKKTLNIIKFSDHVDKCINIKYFNHSELSNPNSQIIDLVNKKKNSKNIFYFKNILKKKKNIKESTFDFISKLSRNFKVNNYKIFSNKKLLNNKKAIFINWIVPNDWKIKSRPLKKWKQIKKKIQLNTKYKKVILQNKKDSLTKYFKKIKSSDLVVSVVGFGCHIAILFNKPLVLLTGPTYFKEIENYKNVKIYKPQKYCKIHSKKLNVPFNKCDCMKNINYSNVVKYLKNK